MCCVVHRRPVLGLVEVLKRVAALDLVIQHLVVKWIFRRFVDIELTTTVMIHSFVDR